MTAGEIAERFSCRWPTTTRHLRELESAGLVSVEKRGRERVYHLKAGRLRSVAGEWLDWFEASPATKKRPAPRLGGRNSVPTEKQVLKHLRKICLQLPEARETKTFGHPTFQAGKKTFAVLEEYDGDLTICFKTSRAEQRRLCKHAGFFAAPYIGKHGWTSLKVGGKIDWLEVERLVLESYRQMALKRMLAALDG
jgi:predicted DNA-binding protein (MmcQ/YjbR family)